MSINISISLNEYPVLSRAVRNYPKKLLIELSRGSLVHPPNSLTKAHLSNRSLTSMQLFFCIVSEQNVDRSFNDYIIYL